MKRLAHLIKLHDEVYCRGAYRIVVGTERMTDGTVILYFENDFKCTKKPGGYVQVKK